MQVSKVLVVDGDRAQRDALVTCLQFVGVEAHGAECAASAQFWLSRDAADVIVFSDEVGGGLAELIDRCAQRPDAANASILVLSREGVSRRLPPNYHCDVMLRRPVAVSRVVERVESLIDQRRNAGGLRLTFGVLSLDVTAARIVVGERSLPLGRTESRLLAFFMGMPDRVFSRAQLLQRLWPAGVRVEQRTVDVHIRRLRSTLDELGCADYIQTVRGSGYRFSRQLD
jgi:two-component system, OmpR family, phosphate regulon response regulator PhoB